MTSAVETRPAALPLPGGREGASVRLRPLLVARLKVPPAMFHREEGGLAGLRAMGLGVPRPEWLEIPAVAFHVEHPGAGHVLIDTGFHSTVATRPEQAFGRLGGLVFKDVRMRPDEAVVAQLGALGIAPSDVAVVVMTHLHSDHASGVAELPASTFVVTATEWEAARRGGATSGYFRRQFELPFDWRLLDFDAAGPYASFGRSLDLFGDGSVRLVSTPGHSLGHLTVLLRLRGREALVAGDAIYTMRTLRESDLPYRMADEQLFRRSLREIQDYVRDAPDALVVPGHDMDLWRTLDERYE